MTHTKLYMKLWLLMFFAIGAFRVQSQKNEQIDELMRTYSDFGKFSGAVLVAEENEIIYQKGFGYANEEWQIPNSTNGKFRIGSITKQFTSMLAMQLVEEGKLDLNQSIANYLPNYPKQNGDRITAHHLLTHTSGIPNFTAFPQYMREYMRKRFSSEQLVQLFADSTLEFSPGEKYNYSNSGYVLLGYLIEQVAQQSYESLLQEKILNPLEMTGTGIDKQDKIIPNRVSGYFNRITGNKNADFIDMSVPFSAGAMYSTLEDLYKWDQALYTNKLLSSDLRKKLFDPHISAGRFDYGYGWAVGDIPFGENGETLSVVHHSGGINGFNALITRYPKDQKTIIFLGNFLILPLEEITQNITSILYEKPYELPKESMTKKLVGWIDSKGPKSAIKLFKKNKESYEPVQEFEMNQVGYEYLQSGKITEAIAVFEINVSEFPNSFNVYDSYAEGLMYKGDVKGAITNYKKSMEINPDNMNGIQMLKRLGVDYQSEEPKEINVDKSILSTYAGTYELAPNFKIVVTTEGDKIFAQATGQPKLEIYPETENKFYSKMVDAKVVFNKGSGDQITNLTLIQGGAEQLANKIK